MESGVYHALTGAFLLFAAILMVVRMKPASPTPPGSVLVGAVGALAGFASGITGIGGGVFLAPAMIALAWITARQSAGLSAPFILGNSIFGLAGALLAGQLPATETPPFAIAALTGAVAGTMVGLRLMTERATRMVLAAILVAAAIRLLAR